MQQNYLMIKPPYCNDLFFLLLLLWPFLSHETNPSGVLVEVQNSVRAFKFHLVFSFKCQPFHIKGLNSYILLILCVPEWSQNLKLYRLNLPKCNFWKHLFFQTWPVYRVTLIFAGQKSSNTIQQHKEVQCFRCHSCQDWINFITQLQGVQDLIKTLFIIHFNMPTHL